MSSYYEILRCNTLAKGENPAALLEELYRREYRVKEKKCSGGDLIPYHTHGDSEIIVLYEGFIRLIIEEDIVDLKEGEMILIEPWAIHLCSFPQGPARFYLCYPCSKK